MSMLQMELSHKNQGKYIKADVIKQIGGKNVFVRFYDIPENAMGNAVDIVGTYKIEKNSIGLNISDEYSLLFDITEEEKQDLWRLAKELGTNRFVIQEMPEDIDQVTENTSLSGVVFEDTVLLYRTIHFDTDVIRHLA